MTIHKSKGKQFDGVIVIREGRHDGQRQVSSFACWDDEPPYWRSRTILRVGVTRARVHTLILQYVFPACPIMAGIGQSAAEEAVRLRRTAVGSWRGL